MRLFYHLDCPRLNNMQLHFCFIHTNYLHLNRIAKFDILKS
jgi:hypothetical protein